MKPFYLKTLFSLLIFCGTFGFIFWVSTIDFGSGKKTSQDQASLLQKVEEIQKAYYGISPYWLKRHNITLTSSKEISQDIDHDGLDLLEEYRYLTDPFDSDTDRDGYADGREVKNGYNPTGNGLMDKNKNGLPDTWEIKNELSTNKDESASDNDNDGLTNKEEFSFGTNPRNNDTDKDGFIDGEEVKNGYDPDATGDSRPHVEVYIPKINILVPLTFSRSTDEEVIQKDLENGAILYPQTAQPGQKGNAIITAHSSNYAWAPGNYKSIFKDLDTINVGDEIIFRLTQKNGKKHEITYRVQEKFVAMPDDERIFEDTYEKEATFVTCWPLNTSWKRLVLKTRLQ